jgi:hypothetical protein
MAAKRGRKRKNLMYFGPEEEAAVVKFLNEKDEIERNKIYNQWLRNPLDKMIESIIRKYGYFRKTETFEELHSDTQSFLATKFDKFDHTTGKKAYSYYGTICKHYILGLLIKDDKRMKQNLSYEEINTFLDDDERFSYEIDNEPSSLSDLIDDITREIKVEIKNSETAEGKKKLSENELKVGNAIVEILDNWEVIFDNLDEGNKYNKNSFYSSVREYTDLSTKDIRSSLKRFKKLYDTLRIMKIDDDTL